MDKKAEFEHLYRDGIITSQTGIGKDANSFRENKNLNTTISAKIYPFFNIQFSNLSTQTGINQK